MKKLFLSITLLLSLSVHSQTIEQRIDSARSFSEMPALSVTVTRETSLLKYTLYEGKLSQTGEKIPPGQTITLYFPLQVYDSGNWSRAEEKYNYISTTPEFTGNLIHRNLVLYVSPDDRRLLIAWLNKYESLGKERMKIEQPTSPY